MFRKQVIDVLSSFVTRRSLAMVGTATVMVTSNDYVERHVNSDFENYVFHVKNLGVCSCERRPNVDFDENVDGTHNKRTWWSNVYMMLSYFKRANDSIEEIQQSLPRPLMPKDVAFDWPELREGLKKRKETEMKLMSLQSEVRALAFSNQSRDDRNKAAEKLADKIASIAYGAGITANMRQEYLLKYGCTAWTDELMKILLDLGKGRGFVEVGCGNGQWARQLVDLNAKQASSRNDVHEFVIAYDDYTSLPLHPNLIESNQELRRKSSESFYSDVKRGNHLKAFEKENFSSRGRILLLVYPDPSSMAKDTLESYVNQDPLNDTVVYIGEGRNGANADEEFFNTLEFQDGQKRWVLERIIKLNPFGNGYERAFVFRRK